MTDTYHTCKLFYDKDIFSEYRCVHGFYANFTINDFKIGFDGTAVDKPLDQLRHDAIVVIKNLSDSDIIVLKLKNLYMEEVSEKVFSSKLQMHFNATP